MSNKCYNKIEISDIPDINVRRYLKRKEMVKCDCLEYVKRTINLRHIKYIYHTDYNIIEDYEKQEYMVIEDDGNGDIYDVMSKSFRNYCGVK